MYITTSRKPSDQTRKFARLFANFIGVYENRGKKSIDEAVARARELGEHRIIILSESKGNPNAINFISINNEWAWMEPEITFSSESSKLPDTKGIRKQVKYDGDKIYSNLFDFQEPDTDDVVVVGMNDKHLSFSYGKLKFSVNITRLRKLSKTD